jgi:hypothetical protein
MQMQMLYISDKHEDTTPHPTSSHGEVFFEGRYMQPFGLPEMTSPSVPISHQSTLLPPTTDYPPYQGSSWQY